MLHLVMIDAQDQRAAAQLVCRQEHQGAEVVSNVDAWLFAAADAVPAINVIILCGLHGRSPYKKRRI